MAAKKEVMTMELYEALESNEVKVGGKIVNMDTREGNQRMDKDGNPMFSDDGSPIFWDDSYYVEFAFTGGSSTFKLSPALFATVEMDNRYQMQGRIVSKTPFGGGKSYLAVEPLAFNLLF